MLCFLLLFFVVVFLILKDVFYYIFSESLKVPSYSFYAHNVTQKRTTAGDILIFSIIQLDEPGVYNITTGKYTSQTDEIYIFYASICLEGGHGVAVNLVGGQNVIDTIQAGDKDFVSCSSGTATARLQKGDEVYQEVAYYNLSVLLDDYYRRNSFSGYLISV